MHVGCICAKQGLAIKAPFLWHLHAAVALEFLPFVERKKTFPYPPEHKTTASAVCFSISPVFKSLTTMPLALPSITIKSNISLFVNSSICFFET